MRKLRHPLSGAVYEEAGTDRVQVTDREGVTGVFTGDGRWVSGELRHADPEVCRWVRSGDNPSPRIRSNRRFTALTSKMGSQS
ncbi:MAG TPA: hypothetical protein VFN68_15945 [Acidimicrobiales bacterium]|nr:hypothetical protein [Acidimicrobiales bacterium]